MAEDYYSVEQILSMVLNVDALGVYHRSTEQVLNAVLKTTGTPGLYVNLVPEDNLDFLGYNILNEQSAINAGRVSSYYLNGTSQYIEVADDADLDFGTGDFAIFLKFRPDGVSAANQYLANKEAGGVGYGLEMREDDLYIRCDDDTKDVSGKIGTGVFAAGQDVDVFVEFDRSGNATAYVNGVSAGTVAISTASKTLSSAGVLRFGTESGGVTKEFSGQYYDAAVFNMVGFSADERDQIRKGNIPFKYVGASATELIGDQVDRDFSGASDWTNNDINAYNETGDLTITADAADQYCTLAATEAPTTVGKRYRLSLDVANLVSTWTIKDEGGTQTLATIDAEGTGQIFEFTAETDGGFMIVADADDSSADFDNFSQIQIGCVGKWSPASMTPTIWADEMPNNNNGAVTGSFTGYRVVREFFANAFQYPNPGTDWTPAISGATLANNLSSKKCWLPLNFLKEGDRIISYKLVGDVHEEAGDTVTLDAKLVRVNKANPITTTDVAGGGITQVTADGNVDAAAELTAEEEVATDKQYLLEIQGSTSTVSGNEAIKVIGAEVKVVRLGG